MEGRFEDISMDLEIPENAAWLEPKTLAPEAYECGYCGHEVSSEKGYALAKGRSANVLGHVRICPHCLGPSFFAPSGIIVPGVAFGESIEDLPDEVDEFYEEARRCASENCHTAAVLLCRKILSHVAVSQNGEPNQPVEYYVNYLADEGYIPPNGMEWVEHICGKNSEAVHEIVPMSRDDAEDFLTFVEMILRFVYDFPNRLPAAS